MSHTAHIDTEYFPEHSEPSDEVLTKKIDRLVRYIRKSEHFVIFAGAGISTSAGISDFRGPNGVWTMKALGKQPVASVSTVKAVPTSTHMAIVELQRQNICKYLISQNCDGLHRRSGIAPERISELHGNSNIEYCETCGHEYLRDFACYRKVHGSRDHYTGRHCVMQNEGKLCNGRLMNSTIDFGQNLPVEPLSNAEWNSTKSDLHLCLGSSLTVSPACTMPELTKLRGGKLVIVNLQKTPLTEMADMHIFARTDDVMRAVMQRLQIDIPTFKLHREVMLGSKRIANKFMLTVSAVERGTNGQTIPASNIQKVQVLLPDCCTERRQQSDTEPFTFSTDVKGDAADGKVTVRIHSMGHYGERPYDIVFPFAAVRMRITLEYDPLEASWQARAVDESRSIASDQITVTTK